MKPEACIFDLGAQQFHKKSRPLGMNIFESPSDVNILIGPAAMCEIDF